MSSASLYTDSQQQVRPPFSYDRVNRARSWRLFLVSLCLAVITSALYSPVRDYDFVNVDDNNYVYKNRHVSSGVKLQNVYWAFTHSHTANWHPLTWLSHMLDCQLWGLNPGPHHLVNVAFHVLNSILLFLVLNAMTQR